MKVFFSILGVIVAMFLLGWAIQGNDFFMYKVFAPKYEQVRRDTYENSTSYVQGTIQELDRLRVEYETATTESAKETVAAVILRRSEGFPEDRLPNDLLVLIKKLRNEQIQKRKDIR